MNWLLTMETQRQLGEPTNDMLGFAEVAELRRVNAELRDQNEALSLFIKGLAHDLKTPLTPLVGASELLATGIEAKPWSDLAHSIRLSAENLHRMVDELLDLEKCECGVLMLEYAVFDVRRLLREAVETFSGVATARNIKIVFDVPEKLESLKADADRLTQVVIILLDNAVRHTPRGGRVGLQAAALENFFRVNVTDNGNGLAPEEIPDAFRPYRQSNSRKGSLGLALVSRLIELHGGQVGAESIAGANNFWFTVPIAGPMIIGEMS